MRTTRFNFYANLLSQRVILDAATKVAGDFELCVMEVPKSQADFQFFVELSRFENFKGLDLRAIEKENPEIVRKLLRLLSSTKKVELIYTEPRSVPPSAGLKRSRAASQKATRVPLKSLQQAAAKPPAKPEVLVGPQKARVHRVAVISNLSFKDGQFSRPVQIKVPTVLSISSLVREADEAALATVLRNPLIARINFSQITVKSSEINSGSIIVEGREVNRDKWIAECFLRFAGDVKDGTDYLKILREYFIQSQVRAKELVDESIKRVLANCLVRAPKISMPTDPLIPIYISYGSTEVNLQWIGTSYDRSRLGLSFFSAPKVADPRRVPESELEVAEEPRAGAGSMVPN